MFVGFFWGFFQSIWFRNSKTKNGFPREGGMWVSVGLADFQVSRVRRVFLGETHSASQGVKLGWIEICRSKPSQGLRPWPMNKSQKWIWGLRPQIWGGKSFPGPTKIIFFIFSNTKWTTQSTDSGRNLDIVKPEVWQFAWEFVISAFSSFPLIEIWPKPFFETFFKLETQDLTWRPQQKLELAITCLDHCLLSLSFFCDQASPTECVISVFKGRSHNSGCPSLKLTLISAINPRFCSIGIKEERDDPEEATEVVGDMKEEWYDY